MDRMKEETRSGHHELARQMLRDMEQRGTGDIGGAQGLESGTSGLKPRGCALQAGRPIDTATEGETHKTLSPDTAFAHV